MMIYILLLCVGVASAGVGRFRRGGYGRPDIFPPALPDTGFPQPPPPPPPPPQPMGGGYGRPSYGGGGYGGPSSFTSVNIYDQPHGGYGRPSGYGRPASFGGFGQDVGFGGGSDFGSFGGRK